MFASLLALSLAYAPGLGVTHGRTLGPSCRRSAVVTMGPPIEMLPKPTDDEIAKIKSSWGTWGCEAMPLSHALFFEHARLPPNSHERDACRLCVPGDVSEFPWTYSDDEAALILEGEVTRMIMPGGDTSSSASDNSRLVFTTREYIAMA